MQLVDDMETKFRQIHVQIYTWMCGKVISGLKTTTFNVAPISPRILNAQSIQDVWEIEVESYVIGKCNLKWLIQQDNKSLDKLGMLMDRNWRLWMECSICE